MTLHLQHMPNIDQHIMAIPVVAVHVASAGAELVIPMFNCQLASNNPQLS